MIRGMSHPQINDGQHHEYEGLQGDDQQMENQPTQVQHHLQGQHDQ